jgi:hypothetical protein
MRRGKTRTLDRTMPQRWISELAIPGNPDISSIYAGYVLAGILAVALVFARLTDFWQWFIVAILAVGLQLPLLIIVALAKFRGILPPAGAHARMFRIPGPLDGVGWVQAFGPFLLSLMVLTGFALYERAGAV